MYNDGGAVVELVIPVTGRKQRLGPDLNPPS